MQMGLHISVTQVEEVHGEMVGSLQVEGARLKGTTIAGADSAALIDEIPVLAAIAPYTEHGIEVRGPDPSAKMQAGAILVRVPVAGEPYHLPSSYVLALADGE